MNSSIVSYPDRGKDGDSRWRGNTTGHIVRDLFTHLRPDSVCDPMEGSGTTGDVCRSLGITYFGFDLHSGFNALRDRLATRLPQQVSHIWTHPAYHSILQYTGTDWVAKLRPESPWANKPCPDDLSRCADYDEFLEKLNLAFLNFWEGLRPGGTFACLIGDIRKNGAYYSPQADIINFGLGKLKNVIIKQQHNTVSERKSYGGAFIPIAHEYLLVFEKEAGLTLAELGIAQTSRISRKYFGTWKTILTVALRNLGGQADLQKLYAYIGRTISAPENTHIEAKVRQTLQRHFVRVDEGVYSLPQAA